MLLHSKKRGYAINLRFDNFWIIAVQAEDSWQTLLNFVTYENGGRAKKMFLSGFGGTADPEAEKVRWDSLCEMRDRIISALKAGEEDFDMDAISLEIAEARKIKKEYRY